MMPEDIDGEDFEITRDDLRQWYSDTVIDHVFNPKNLKEMPDANGFGEVDGSCGDTMRVWVKVKDGVIADISFTTNGCGATIASGSMVTELAKGKSFSEAMALNQHDVLDALGGLPEDNEHCARLAVSTLKAALNDYIALQKEPWKKAYREH